MKFNMINEYPLVKNKYTIEFYCIDNLGDNKSEYLLFPSLLPFYYVNKKGEIDDCGWWLLEDFSIALKLNDKWYKITCKAGFDFDGASIPRVVRSIVGDKMAHDIIVAALFHDIFYCVHDKIFNRKVSDKTLSLIIKYYGGTKAKERIVLNAVSLFGRFCWNKSDAELEKYRTLFEIKEIN